jgi:peptidoglycan/LPS O-acetylase OafA/YrhL
MSIPNEPSKEVERVEPGAEGGETATRIQSSRKGSSTGRSVALDFVRGIAIMLVIWSHSPVPDPTLFSGRGFGFTVPQFGWYGVDMFFVLSGFLVGGLLFKEYGMTGQIDGKRFLIRRGFKIWPQYYIFVAVAAFLKLAAHRPTGRIWPNLLNVQNYWPTALHHTWSLAVEEHFYLTLTLIVSILAVRRTISIRAFQIILLGAVAISITSRLAYAAAGMIGAMAEFTNSRIESLALGVLLAAIFNLDRSRFIALTQKRYILWPLFLGSVASWLFDVKHAHLFFLAFEFWATSLGAAAVLLLFCFPTPGSWMERAAGYAPYRFVAWIGRNSYGIYLWHLAGGIRPGEIVYEKLGPHVPDSIARLGGIAAYWVGAIAIGVLTTIVIEQPFLKLRDRLYPSRGGTVTLKPSSQPPP